MGVLRDLFYGFLISRVCRKLTGALIEKTNVAAIRPPVSRGGAIGLPVNEVFIGGSLVRERMYKNPAF
jgi:hypothetical protein